LHAPDNRHRESARTLASSQPIELDARDHNRRKAVVTVALPPTRRTWPGVPNDRVRLSDSAIFNGADCLLDVAERLVKRAVAMVLMGIAMAAVIMATVTLVSTSAAAATAMTSALDSLLFAVILVEIAATMRREERNPKAKWYLVIGITSAVRETLTVGARISLHTLPTHEALSVVLEMAVMIAVVIGLAVALRVAGVDTDSEGSESSVSDVNAGVLRPEGPSAGGST
jgi:hypothetical protein